MKRLFEFLPVWLTVPAGCRCYKVHHQGGFSTSGITLQQCQLPIRDERIPQPVNSRFGDPGIQLQFSVAHINHSATSSLSGLKMLPMKYDGNIIIAILHLLHKLTVTFSRRCNCRLHFNQDCNTPRSIKNGAILHPSPESKSQKPIQSITLVF